jgi:hypothetical protein
MPITDPAFWSDQLRNTFKCYDEPLLRQVAGRLFKPRNQWPAEELINRSLATFGNPAVIDRRLKELEPAQRQILALIGHSRQPRWQLGNLIELVMALGHSDGLPPILGLFESGLLYPCLPDGLQRLKKFEQWLGQAGSTGLKVFAHPLVTDRALGEDLGLPDLSESAGEGESDGVKNHKHSRTSTPSPLNVSPHESDGLELPLRLAVLWQQVSANPLRRTQQGDFFKRDMERLTQDSLLAGAANDSLIDLPDPGLLTVALAEIEGILEENRGELCGANLPAGWEEGLLPALASLWASLPCLGSWNALKGGAAPTTTGHGNPYPSAYLLALLLLARMPPESWTSPTAVEEWLFSHHPHWTGESIRPSQRRSWIASFLLGLAYQMRLVQAGKTPAGEWLVRLSEVGRWLLGMAEAPHMQSYPQTLVVQPNLEIIAYRQGLTPALIAQLSRIADWKSLGAACLLQLGPASVYRALQSGQSFEQMLQTLERHCMRGLPSTIVDSLRTWADKRERIAVYPSATLFEFASADDLAEALTRGLPATRLNERLAVVAGESAIDFRHFRLTGTRDYALPPEKCVEVEEDGVTLSIDLSRSDLLVETEVRRFAELRENSNHLPLAPRGGEIAAERRRQYGLSLTSLAAGRNSGFGLRALEEWFLQRTGKPLSAAARLLSTAGQLSPGSLRPKLVLNVASAETADGLLQWPGTRALIEERLGPTTLAIAEENAAALREQLHSLGINVES